MTSQPVSLSSRLKLPSREELLASRWLRPFARYLGASVLWRWNRRSVARGLALGLFAGIIIPFVQTPLAALFAVFARANLAVAALATFVTNPFTTAPIYIAAYQVGCLLIDAETGTQRVRGDWLDRALSWLQQASLPTALGLLIFAVTSAVLGYAFVHLSWRWRVARRWRRRAQRRMAALA